MPIAKSNGTAAEKPATSTATDVAQTAPAPVARTLNTTPPEARKEYKGRDYDAEARGKVACAAFNAALASPGLAMFPAANLDEYFAKVEKAADRAVAYTWRHQNENA